MKLKLKDLYPHVIKEIEKTMTEKQFLYCTGKYALLLERALKEGNINITYKYPYFCGWVFTGDYSSNEMLAQAAVKHYKTQTKNGSFWKEGECERFVIFDMSGELIYSTWVDFMKRRKR